MKSLIFFIKVQPPPGSLSCAGSKEGSRQVLPQVGLFGTTTMDLGQ